MAFFAGRGISPLEHLLAVRIDPSRALNVLRPRQASELVDATFALTRAFFGPLFVLAALDAIAALLISLTAAMAGVGTDASSAAELLEGVISIAVSGILTGAGCVVVSDAYLTGQVDLSRALRAAMDRAWTLAWVSVVTSTLIIVGLFLLVVPGVVLLIRYFALWPIIMLEQRGGLASVRRSRALARGRGRKLFAVVGLATLMVIAISVGGQIALEEIVRDARTAGMLATALTSLLGPLISALTVLAYYDARVEAEGYDLELAASTLPAPPYEQPTAT